MPDHALHVLVCARVCTLRLQKLTDLERHQITCMRFLGGIALISSLLTLPFLPALLALRPAMICASLHHRTRLLALRRRWLLRFEPKLLMTAALSATYSFWLFFSSANVISLSREQMEFSTTFFDGAPIGFNTALSWYFILRQATNGDQIKVCHSAWGASVFTEGAQEPVIVRMPSPRLPSMFWLVAGGQSTALAWRFHGAVRWIGQPMTARSEPQPMRRACARSLTVHRGRACSSTALGRLARGSSMHAQWSVSYKASHRASSPHLSSASSCSLESRATIRSSAPRARVQPRAAQGGLYGACSVPTLRRIGCRCW